MTNDELIEMLKKDKESAYLFRRRRHEDWTENYTLYRDKVILNRLTQRQSVNIPLMKYSLKTLLKDIDDAPVLYFESLDNDDQKEVYYNEYFKHCQIENKFIIKDIVDKKQVLLFGRSFKKLNITNGLFTWSVVDPQDILIDRFVDPSDLDSARFLIHEHIYLPLSSLATHGYYDKGAIRELQNFYSTEEGLIKAEANQMDWVEKQKRMSELGLQDAMTPALGETYVELNEFFIKMYDEKQEKDIIQFIVTADNTKILFNKPLDEVIGETNGDYWESHYPYTSWADDTERTDFWSDGVADVIRTPNKVLNSWFSQEVEARTLHNFGMNYYDATLAESFVPQTYDPVPGGWFPVPGDPSKVIKRVDIDPLDNSMDSMQFLMGIADKASAATTMQQGVQEKQQITLGETQLLLANAKERVKSMAVFYTDSWKEFGMKYTKMIEASEHLLDPVTIHKKGRLGRKMYTKTIDPSHWKSDLGYHVDVKMMADKQQEDADSLQKLNAARSIMPDNVPLDEIYKKKLLEFSNLNSDEMAEVMKFEKMKADALQQGQMGTQPQTRQPYANINYKDLPPQGQQQLAQQQGIQLSPPPQQQPVASPVASPVQQPMARPMAN